ncbi:MAG: tetratricopeptide repeat protein [Proteobacteria bacterium]|nr:tetratricopeptide repeat protein [Pseudomonadota bacterium]
MQKKQFSRWNKAVWVVALLVAVSFCACSSMEEKRDKFLASGQALYQQEDYVRARLQFQNALQIDPKFAAAYLWKAKTELKLQNPRGAYGALNEAVELNPDLTEAQILLGDLFLMAKQLDKAKEKAELALKQEPNNTDALLLSASLAMAQSQPQKALEVLAEVRRLDPGKIPAYLLEASILAKEKKLEGVAAILEHGIKANPKALNLYVARAGLADNQKQFEVGESFLLQAIAQEPKNPGLYHQLVRHYAMTGQRDKAEAALRRSVSLEPDSEKPVIMLARFLAGQGRRQEAETTLQGFIKGHPDNYPARFGLAEFYSALQRQGQAVQVLEEIIKLDPNGPKGAQAKNELARLKLAQDHIEAAEKQVNEILKDYPKDMQATETRGIIALKKKDGLTAVNSFRLLTQDRPRDPQVWLLLARGHLLNKEERQAKETAKKALEIKPDFLEARKFLYGIFLQDKDYDGAIATIQSYLRFNGKDLFNLVTLGEVYALKGDFAQARATFQKVIDLEPKNPQGYFQMARLGLQTKKTAEALKYADKALQANPDFLPALQFEVGIYQDQKQPEKALAAVRQTLARSPKNPQLHQLLGDLLLVQKQPQAAVAPLEEALNLNPRLVSALQLLALAYQQMPNADHALQQLEAKVGDPKSSPLFSLVLATVYERQQKFDQAINLYNSLLARNLFTSLAKNNLAYLMAEHQPTADNLARAQKLSAETLEDNPEAPGFLDTMGWILCKQERYAQAKTYLEKASEHAPGQPAMLYHLAWCEAKLGDTAAARAALQKALDSKTKFMERDAAQKLLDSLPAGGK